MQYRAEIDGLRALAVVPVIAFHGEFPGFGGGFIGVDIFFVISGYLITTIIWQDLDAGRFTIRSFYERRIRRIIPALLLVIAASFLGGWFLLGPMQFDGFARSALAALFFVSNVHFWSEAGYFAAEAETLPLLHTWSLAVEEQFYLLFPLLLVAMHRWRGLRAAALVTGAIAVASFALAEAGWRFEPDANFFLAPSRAWELMAGALCAFWLLHRPDWRGNEWLALGGLALLAASFALIHEGQPFPSYRTALPVMGTAAIILFAHGNTLAARFLALRPFVAIGLVSYSAYLWHQPLFVFTRASLLDPPPLPLMMAIAGLAFVLAWLSWRLVERPFRRTAKPHGKAWPLWWLAAGAAATTGASLIVIQQAGFIQRFDPAAVASIAEIRKPWPRYRECTGPVKQVVPIPCEGGERSAPQWRIAMIGDSKASQWADAMDHTGQQRGWLVDNYAKGACGLAESRLIHIRHPHGFDQCRKWRDRLYPVLRAQRYDLIVATQSSGYYLDAPETDFDQRADWEGGFERMIERLDGTGVPWLYLSNNPTSRQRDPVQCVFKTRVLGLADPGACVVPRSQALNDADRAYERAAIARSHNGRWIDLADLTCDARECQVEQDGMILMQDRNHLSRKATQTFAPTLADKIAARLSERP